MISYRCRLTPTAKRIAVLALILAALLAPSGPASAQEAPIRVWLPIVTFSPVCDIGPRVVVTQVVEPGVSIRYDRWQGCPWSEIQFMQTYMDEAGATHNTHSLPIEPGRWYYTSRWIVWRGGQWVPISEAEALAVRDAEVVRMYISVQVTGQNYTHQSTVGRP